MVVGWEGGRQLQSLCLPCADLEEEGGKKKDIGHLERCANAAFPGTFPTCSFPCSQGPDVEPGQQNGEETPEDLLERLAHMERLVAQLKDVVREKDAALQVLPRDWACWLEGKRCLAGVCVLPPAS